ncbi:transcriptional regulator, ArsR family [Actinacidiphila yanglinensis]|uniref:Transcriptional regulator, ArsR family n=1 Tax=Actinacidiphila yanglinensis TaxID=310779 RepID=A0A1H5S869_9ACTN|nr:helix-turn-helix transcriptional regulator [Actinacidiphila yanglinensis]SEF46007.1 transcriptional regulator, ArsR family [Actinacidiphila yanglinensis]
MRELSGDANFAVPAALIGDRTRARMLLALLDRRSLPMSMLATEAGVAQSTASAHLARLVDGGLLSVERSGRHRFYRLASADVAHALESLARLSAPFTPNSLRSSTRAHALRAARSCYDHTAGHLGVAVMGRLIEEGGLSGGDGRFHPEDAVHDRPAAPGRDLAYEVTAEGWRLLGSIGVERPRTSRPLVRYCVDWTEQRHHLAGAVGAALLDRFLARKWVERRPDSRALRVLPAGEDGFRDWLAIDPRDPAPAA